MEDYRPNITCESLEVIGELMPVNIPQDSIEIHSEMLKLIGSYTQHYNAKTRSNAFNTMVMNKNLIMYFVFIFLYVNMQKFPSLFNLISPLTAIYYFLTISISKINLYVK